MKKINLQGLFAEYISECEFSKGLRSETIKSYKVIFEHFSNMMPEVISADLLTREILNKFFKRIRERERIVGKNTKIVGLADSTIHAYGNKLNTFFVWLLERKIIKENPLNGIKLSYPQYNDQRALKKEEIHRIISTISLNSTNSFMLKRDLAMVHLLVFCGLRFTEFVSLQGRDIDMEARILTVRAETSKSKRSRTIPIHPTLLIHLREYIEERKKRHYKTEYFFASNSEDKRLTRFGLRHWVKRLIVLSGVKFHLHKFRHTFACNCVKADMSLIKIRDLMGHKSLRMTESYLRSIVTDDLREDINKLNI